MRKSLSNRLLSIPALIILIVVLATAAVDYSLARAKEKIERQFSRYLGQKVSISTVSYLPPNFIVLTKAAILKDTPLGTKSLLAVGRARLTFSPLRLLTRKELFVSTAYLNKMRTDYSLQPQAFREDINQIKTRLLNISRKQTIKLVIKDAALSLPGQSATGAPLKFNSVLTLKNCYLAGRGSAGVENFFLNFNFRGILSQESLDIENLELKIASFYAKLWGGLQKDSLRLNGFSLLKNYSGDFTFNILDLSCLVKFALPLIQIENLSFSVNNVPLKFQGDIFLSEEPLVNLALSVQKINASLRNLSFSFSEQKHLMMSVENGSLSYLTKPNPSSVSFKDLNVDFDPGDGKTGLFKFNCAVYDGSLGGEGFINTHQVPLKAALNLKIKDITASKLGFLTIDFSNTRGKVDTQINFRNYARPNLSGEVVIRQGNLGNVKFFNWLADFFGIESLRSIDFDRLRVEFLMDQKLLNLTDISLKSKDLELGGYFRLDQNEMVSSKISLALTREILLNYSPNFRTLIKMLKIKSEYLNFDFQLSGPLYAMNFKWLESDFKKRLQEFIPESNKQEIEKGVEDIINSIGM